MTNNIDLLPKNARRGSKPRCHWITDGDRATVAGRLTALIQSFGTVAATDRWMPGGFVNLAEADLGKASGLLGARHCEKLRDWWLVHPAGARTPNIDIAAMCTVGESTGIVLVEAKAHVRELTGETHGKRLDESASANSIANHERIGECIAEASRGLTAATTLTWDLSRDSHYQMANRFAWAWKLATLGFPVILVYLGFLNAEDMRVGANGMQNDLLTDHDMWRNCVLAHGCGRVPAAAWGSTLSVAGRQIRPMIRSVEVRLDGSVGVVH